MFNPVVVSLFVVVAIIVVALIVLAVLHHLATRPAKTRKPRNNMLMILVVIMSLSIALSACGTKQPCANACGLTSPVSQAEKAIINFVDQNPNDNVLK